MKVYEILPKKLYQRGDLAKVTEPDRTATLTSLGITMIVTLYGPADLALPAWVKRVHHPIPDGKQVPELRGIAQEVAEHLQHHGRALVTCHAGRNRSGFLNALIVRQLLNLSGVAALTLVRVQRPRAVANLAFERYLEELPEPF